MNAVPGWYDWAIVIGVVAVGSSTVVLLSAAAASLVRPAAWVRMSWRLAVVVLLVLLGGELTGVARGLGRWTISQCIPRDRSSDSLIRSRDTASDSVAAPSERDESEVIPWADGPAADLDRVDIRSAAIGPLGDATSASADDTSIGGWLAKLAHRSTWWPGIIWAGGALLLGVRLTVGRLLGMAYRRRHAPQTDAELSRRLQGLARRLGMNRVRGVVVRGITGPIAFGVIRPTVGVPPCFTSEFDATQQTVMLAHELEHLAASDPAWYLVADLMVAVLWWHPLVWWARRQLRAASEWAADEASLVVQDGPDVLAACLVQLGGRLLRGQRPAWLGIAGGGFRSGLGRRVTRLLSLSERPWRRPGAVQSNCMRVLVTVTMVVAALISTGWSNIEAIPTGENMRFSLHQSWCHSLAAVALITVFGNATVPADAATMPDELLLGFASEPSLQKEGDEPSREEAGKHAQAILQKLQQVNERIEELKENGNLDDAKKLSAERDELKAVLEKLNKSVRVRIAKEGKKTDPIEAKGKVSQDSIDALHERMRQLERENAELREALADTKRRIVVGGSEKGRDNVERAHKEMQELHEKLSKDRHDTTKMEDAVKKQFDMQQDYIEQKGSAEHGRWLLEKTIRDKVERAQIEEKELGALHEKLQKLTEDKAKLKEKGRLDEAEKIEADMRKLKEVAEKVSKVKADQDYQKLASSHVQDVGAVLKELREEVSRLRSEVAELRHMVKEGSDSKEQKRSVR